MTTINPAAPLAPHDSAATPADPSAQAQATQAQATPSADAQLSAPDPAPLSSAASGQDAAVVSPSGLMGKQMLDAARKSSGVNQEMVNRLAQDIASGIYRPPPAAIAQALVRTEETLLGGGT